MEGGEGERRGGLGLCIISNGSPVGSCSVSSMILPPFFIVVVVAVCSAHLSSAQLFFFFVCVVCVYFVIDFPLPLSVFLLPSSRHGRKERSRSNGRGAGTVESPLFFLTCHALSNGRLDMRHIMTSGRWNALIAHGLHRSLG